MFWIDLSYRYHMPVERLQREISSRHFTELWAKEIIDPQGPERLEGMLAVVCSTIESALVGRDGRSADKFMPDYGRRFRERAEQDLKAFCKAWAERSNACQRGA